MRVFIFALLLANTVWGYEPEAREKLVYASIYADTLIEEFDKMLDLKLATNDTSAPLYSEIYAKILSARNYIEEFNHHNSKNQFQKNTSLLNIRNPHLYRAVVEEIDQKSLLISKEQTHLKNTKSKDSVIYPSATQAGNVTGNTFPRNVWSLTFDDGPRSEKTATVVDNLYKRNIKATFFMLTAEAKKYTDEALNVKNSGMNIALHSYTHPDLNKATDASLAHQITEAKKDLEDLLNVKTSVFRLPYGSGLRNQKVRSMIAKNNYVHIFWNIDTLDWKDKDPKSILERTKKQMKLTPNHSGIILFHDIHAQSVVASELTMDLLLETGMKVCPVEEVISHLNGRVEDCIQ